MEAGLFADSSDMTVAVELGSLQPCLDGISFDDRTKTEVMDGQPPEPSSTAKGVYHDFLGRTPSSVLYGAPPVGVFP